MATFFFFLGFGVTVVGWAAADADADAKAETGRADMGRPGPPRAPPFPLLPALGAVVTGFTGLAADAGRLEAIVVGVLLPPAEGGGEVHGRAPAAGLVADAGRGGVRAGFTFSTADGLAGDKSVGVKVTP